MAVELVTRACIFHRFNGCALALAVGFMLVVSSGRMAVAQQAQFALPAELQGLVADDGSDPANNLKVSGKFRTMPDGRHGLLEISASLGHDWHIYSVTQQAGGPMRTKVVLESSQEFEVLGAFEPDKKPKVRRLEFYDVPIEEHADLVTWSAPIRLASGITPEGLVIHGKLDGQICQDDGGCVPLMTLDTRFEARVEGILKNVPARLANSIGAGGAGPSSELGTPGFTNTGKRRTPPVGTDFGTGTLMAAAAVASPVPSNTNFVSVGAEGFRQRLIHASLSGRVEPAVASPGSTVTLRLTAKPEPGWHVYAYAKKVNPSAISQPTLIGIAEPGWTVGNVEASDAPIVKQTGISIEPEQRYHEGEVTWTVPITIPANAPLGSQTMNGVVGYQTCTDSNCDRPTGAFFEATIEVAAQTGGGATALKFAPGSYSVANKFTANPGRPVNDGAANQVLIPRAMGATGPLSFDLNKIEVDESVSRQSILYIMLLATVGGFLLNFMPCVLPVIGLKIMSFVQQAGEHRSRIFFLNLVYAIGMLSVFWLLALLASGPAELGWGEQFNNDAFTITLLCVVFVMGLSFIGVWEIPIPGFVGSGTASELAQKEGLSGAFFKGVLTTILATPCSGPGVAAAITWSAGKPAGTVFTVFTCMGLGMASPYLVIGAFPNLVRFIPKPGAWMDTFKQTMGFVLMGTVVYLFTLVKTDNFVPTLALMFALWAACWWVGRVPITANLLTKAKGWLAAAGFTAIIGWFAFAYEPNREHDLPWQEFSLATLDEHLQSGKTVLVDFTANWCPTCKVLERTVLNTKPVRRVVDDNGVVTLVADWSEPDPEIGALLDALGSKQLPVIAIFPADDPYRPKKLSGGYTRAALMQRLTDVVSGTSRIGVRPEAQAARRQ